MKKIMTIIMVICFSCYAAINMNLFAQSSDRIIYSSNWDEDIKWGLLHEIKVDKDRTRIDVENLDILEDATYFMVFIPNNPTSEKARYWGFINGDSIPVYCTAYLEIHGGRREAGYYANKPYLGLAAAHSSGLTTFTLLLDGTNHARWKTWATSGTPNSLVESSRGTYYREKVENVTEFSISADIKNALGAGSKLLIYGKYKSEKPEPSIKEFTLTEDCTELTIAGLDAERDKAYCMYFIPNNTTNSNVKYNLYVNDDYNDSHYVSVWHGVNNTHGPTEGGGGVSFITGMTRNPLIARADGNSSLTQHTWIVRDAQGHVRYWCEEASGKYSSARAYGGYHNIEVNNLSKLTIRSSVKNGLAAGSRVIFYSGGTNPYTINSSAVKSRTLEYRWYKEIKVDRDVTELDIKNLNLKAAGFLHIDLIPNNRTVSQDLGGPGHYWSYVNGDMDDLNYCSVQFDVQEGNLCAIGSTLEPYYGWAYPETSSHQPALFMLDAQGHVRSRGYGTCHVQGNIQTGKQSICGRAFHYTKYVDNMLSLKIISNAKNLIGTGTKIFIYGGSPVLFQKR